MDIQRRGSPGEPPAELEAFVKGTMGWELPCLLCEVPCTGRGAASDQETGDWYVHALCHQCQGHGDAPSRSKRLLSKYAELRRRTGYELGMRLPRSVDGKWYVKWRTR